MKQMALTQWCLRPTSGVYYVTISKTRFINIINTLKANWDGVQKVQVMSRYPTVLPLCNSDQFIFVMLDFLQYQQIPKRFQEQYMTSNYNVAWIVLHQARLPDVPRLQISRRSKYVVFDMERRYQELQLVGMVKDLIPLVLEYAAPSRNKIQCFCGHCA